VKSERNNNNFENSLTPINPARLNNGNNNNRMGL
jgi:hypothetical protein